MEAQRSTTARSFPTITHARRKKEEAKIPLPPTFISQMRNAGEENKRFLFLPSHWRVILIERTRPQQGGGGNKNSKLARTLPPPTNKNLKKVGFFSFSHLHLGLVFLPTHSPLPPFSSFIRCIQQTIQGFDNVNAFYAVSPHTELKVFFTFFKKN